MKNWFLGGFHIGRNPSVYIRSMTGRGTAARISLRQKGNDKYKEDDMTKANIAANIARSTGMTKQDTGDVLDALLETISSTLEHGERVNLRGFGVFKVKPRRARVARNPKTGQEIRVPACVVPAFKASDHLKDRVKHKA